MKKRKQTISKKVWKRKKEKKIPTSCQKLMYDRKDQIESSLSFKRWRWSETVENKLKRKLKRWRSHLGCWTNEEKKSKNAEGDKENIKSTGVHNSRLSVTYLENQVKMKANFFWYIFVKIDFYPSTAKSWVSCLYMQTKEWTMEARHNSKLKN